MGKITINQTEKEEDIVDKDKDKEINSFGPCFPGISQVTMKDKKDTIPMSRLGLYDSIVVNTTGI